MDKASRRTDFPALNREMNGKPLVYLDSAASAQKPFAVIEAMDEVMRGDYSNIHRGLYAISQGLTKRCEDVREKIAQFIGAPSANNIIFTKGSTEAINLVAQSWGRKHLTAKDEIILTEMEHHANIVPWQMLQQDIGFKIKTVPVLENGTLDISRFEGMLTQHTKFIGLVHVSNALGTINPAAEIIRIARDFYPPICILLDGSQSAVHMPVDVQTLDCDFFCITGHKLYGPTGIGALYGKAARLNEMPPYQGGGDMIESVSFMETSFKEPPFLFEAGTPPIVEIIGLGAAIDYLSDIGMDAVFTHEQELLAYANEQFATLENVTIYGQSLAKTGIISFRIDGTHTSDLAMILDQQGIAVRTGHHCCMPLMEALEIDGTIRASLGLYTNKDDIDRLVTGIKKAQELLL